MTGLKVSVKTVPRDSSQRRQQQPLVFGSEKTGFINTGKTTGSVKAAGATEYIMFYRSPGTNKYKTGLEEMVPNPFKGESWDTLKTYRNLSDKWNDFKAVVVEDKISKQMWYEILDGTEPGYYTSVMSQDPFAKGSSYDPKKPRTFIEEFSIILYEGLNVFTSDTSRGRLAIQVVKNAPNVAPSRTDININSHTYYIAAENEEVIEAVAMYDKENDAIFDLMDLQRKYPESRLYQFSVVLTDHNGSSLLKGEVAPQIVKQYLNKYIKNKDKFKTENIEKFTNLMELFKNDPQRFEVEYLVAQAINTGVIFEKDGILFWKSKSGDPTVYKFKNRESFKSYILKESEKYNPKEPGNNYYSDLKDEIEAKGFKV